MTKISKKPVSAYKMRKTSKTEGISQKKENIKKVVKKNILKIGRKNLIRDNRINKNSKDKTKKNVGKYIKEDELIERENLEDKKIERSHMDLRKKGKRIKNTNEDSLTFDEEKDAPIEILDKFMTISSDEKATVLILREKEKVVLEGFGLARCLIGRCSINGFELNSQNSHKYPVFSIGPHYSILALPSDNLDRTPGLIKSVIENYGVQDNEVVKKITNAINKFKIYYAVIIFEKLENKFLDKIKELKNYNRNLNFGGLMTMRDGPEKVLFGEDYFRVVQHWRFQTATHPAPVLVLTGDRNTGKSTFNRYLINSTLSSLQRLAYLDCDPGQTEFAAPGCVALNIITTPILGPPFTSISPPELSCFTGLVTPSEQPYHYLSCVRFVLQRYKRDFSNLPLVVNTMGWIEGKGLEMLCSVIESVRPSTLVQLYNRRFKNLLPSFVKTRKLYENTCEDLFEVPLIYDHFCICIPFNSKRCSDGKLTAASLRNLKLLSCLSIQTVKSPSNFAIHMNHLIDAPVYCIPMLRLHLCHDTSSNFLPSSFDVSVCSLCVLNEEELSDKSTNGKLRTTPICESLGMGIIHAVSTSSPGHIYLATNAEPSVLRRVNCLLTGSVRIPMDMVDEPEMRPVNRIGLNYQMDVFGSTSHKSLRRFIPRKRK